MRLLIAIATLLVSSALLLARLGHYALWDDEAITALTARGVWETGDTSAVHGHNLLLYRNGMLLRDLRDRGTPPLQFYVAAPFIGILGNTALAARLPFALAGIGCIGLILWWLYRDEAASITWLLVALALIGNVSLMLYFRQCRYYGLATLLAVAIAYAYLHVRTRRGLVGMSVLLLLLLASNYMALAAVCAALAADYVIWGRKRRWLSVMDWALLLTPLVILGSLIVLTWNPLRIAEPREPGSSWIIDRLTLLWWNTRDINACEYAPGLLVIAAPLLWFVRRDSWLLRSALALAIVVIVISIVSPQTPGQTGVADVRYLSWAIPLCIAVAMLSTLTLLRWSKWMAIVAAVAAFYSNLFTLTPLWGSPIRCTPYLFARELFDPLPEPITPVAQWIEQNVRSGQSVWTIPPYFAYPLMFHAPQAMYAWQLDPPLPAAYTALDRIHVRGSLPPDYIITFGPAVGQLRNISIDVPYPVNYTRIEVINVFWKDLYRPELFWRRFEPITGFDPQQYGVSIFKRRFD